MAITLRNDANQNVAAKATSNGDLKVSISHALPGEVAEYTRVTADQIVHTGPARLVGIISAGTGMITLHDGLSTAGAVIINAFPLTAGTSVAFHNITVANCYCNIQDTVDVTFSIEPIV